MANSTTWLLHKLQHVGGPVVVLNAPPEFAPVLDKWRAEGLPVSQRRTPGSSFVLAFVRNCAELERSAGAVVSSVGRHGTLWFAYPKPTSLRYRTDIGREGSWAVVQRFGFEGVRQISLDDEWSAFRFRHADRARSEAGPVAGSSVPAR